MLLQCIFHNVKQISSSSMLFGEKSVQNKIHLSSNAFINIKKFFFDLFALVSIRLDFPIVVQTRLVTRLHSSIFVYIPLVTRLCFKKRSYILANVSQSKGNQTMKIAQLQEQEKYFSSKIKQRVSQGDQFQTSFCFLKKLYLR